MQLIHCQYFTLNFRAFYPRRVNIYQLVDDQLAEYGWIADIGTSNRWLNPVFIIDLNQDGQLDLFWIQTPHIGGILKVATVTKGKIQVIDTYSGVSNHAIGSRNLCLSAVVETEGNKQIIVPDQSRNRVFQFSYDGQVLTKVSEEALEVDFEIPLSDQLSNHTFSNDNNCLFDF